MANILELRWSSLLCSITAVFVYALVVVVVVVVAVLVVVSSSLLTKW